MNKHRKAVITGAAGGLGAAFSRHLASEGYDLLITDINSDHLNNLADDLRRGGTQVRTIVANLADERDVEELAEAISLDESIQLLINNAGFGLVCKFQSASLPRVIDMIHVHITASLRLCHAALPGMIAEGSGAIINVGSAGAFMRFPRDAAYIGSKSYLVAFTECLALDLVGTGVKVQALCPAWLRTDFTQGSDLAEVAYKSPVPKWLFSSPESVVISSLRALKSGPVTHIPNIRARLAVVMIGSQLGRWLLAKLRNHGMGQSPLPGD